jgi:ppGpp synthetase/RelA/SpoT-type nucleotidyltranferase
LTVANIAEQDSVVQSLANLFEKTSIIDRRPRPSHGYRAVHVIVNCLDKMIEIQVRTSLQHLWAELSEKLSDIVNPAIKYGAGDKRVRTILTETSDMVIGMETLETKLANGKTQLSLEGQITDAEKQTIVELEEENHSLRRQALKILRDRIEHVEELVGENHDLSD